MKRLLTMLMALVSVSVWAGTWTDPVTGYTWKYRINGDTAEIYSGRYSSAAISPESTGAVTIPDTLGGKPVTSIGDYAFCDCSSLTSVTIPNSVTSIGKCAFDSCIGLTSVTIPGSVKEIGKEAFSNCHALVSVNLAEGVEVLGMDAFDGCWSLSDVSIPSTVREIGPGCFVFSKIVSILVAEGNPYFKSIDGIVYSKDGTRLVMFPAGRTGEWTVPEHVAEIAECAVGGGSLTALSIGAGVEKIGDGVVVDSFNLARITVDAGNPYFKDVDGILFSKDGTRLLAYPAAKEDVSVYTVPATVTSVAQDAFGGSLLTGVILPSTLKKLWDETFVDCDNLESVIVGAGLETVGDNAFYCVQNLRTLTLPASVKTIERLAFEDCGNGETTIYVPESAVADEDAYEDCPAKIAKYSSAPLVEFDLNYDSAPNYPYDRNVISGQQVGFLMTPKREYHSFLGWYTAASGGTKVTSATVVNADITFYAHWAMTGGQSHKVTFDANGGSVSPTSKEVAPNSTYGTLPTPTRSGYTFAGWYTAATSGTMVKSTTTRNIASAQTLYARWTANKYTVKFDGNGATSASMKAQARTYGDKKALTGNAFKRTNYHFKGWATAKGGSVKYTDKQVANLTAKSGATVTLYAVWEISTYKVAFNANGGTGTMKAQSINVGASKALTANAFKRTGYTFLGWAKKKTATKADYANKAKVKNLSKDNGATVTLYAVWKANTYTVKFDKNGGTGTMKNLSMTYGKAKALTANAFKRTNYTFLGWAKKKDANKADYTDKGKVKNLKASGTVTLYAVWERDTFKVKFDGNGATSGTVKAQTINIGAKTALTANAFKREGFEFIGWSTKKNATKADYSNKAKVKDLAKKGKSVTLYAVWSLPVWAHGTFNGWCGYWSGVKHDWFDGIVSMKVTSLGAMSGKLSLEPGGSSTASFSTKQFSKYYAKLTMEQLLDLLDYDDEDDTYDIIGDIEDGLAPETVSAYVYKNVTIKMPDGTTRTTDMVLVSWLYGYGSKRYGFVCSCSPTSLDLEIAGHQDVFSSKHVKLPVFSGTPKKAFKVTEEFSTWEDDEDWSGLSKVEVTFGANGKLTINGFKGSKKKWTTTAQLRVWRYHADKKYFDAGADFMTPDGESLWFGCDLTPSKDGKIASSGIKFVFD